MGQFINFNKFPRPKGKKTDVWEITNKSNTVTLGYIQWHGAWRKYCFFPEGRTIWDNKCLTEVQKFIDEQMSERKIKQTQ